MKGNRRFAALALGAWLAASATDVYGTFGLLSTRFGDSEAQRASVIAERERLQGIIGTPFNPPSDALKTAADDAVKAAEDNRKAECIPIRGKRCEGLVAAEQAARVERAATLKAYDAALEQARQRHDAVQALAALQALPVLAAEPAIAIPVGVKLALSIGVLTLVPGIALRWGLALVKR